MNEVIAFIITLVIFILIIWGIIKVIKKGYKLTKNVASNVLVSNETKQSQEQARSLIKEMLNSDFISETQKQKSHIISSLSVAERESLLKNEISKIDRNQVSKLIIDKINDLADCLEIKNDKIRDDITILSLSFLEREFQEGRFELDYSNVDIPLKRDEVIYFACNGDLIGIKTTRHHIGGSRGINFRLAKGLYYRIGAHNGISESIKEDVIKSDGILVITNKRVVFAGNQNSFEIYLDKIINFLFKDSVLVINTSNKQEPYKVAIPSILETCLKYSIKYAISQNT